MKILVTGGAGFIGKHLVKSLLDTNNTVTIYDNLSKSSEDKIAFLLKMGANFAKGDVTDYDTLTKTFSENFDAVVHLAAKTGVKDSVLDPEENFHNNVTGTVRMLRVCKEQNVKIFVAASSGAVYGDSKVLPLSEDLPTIPISPYGASKICMEYYLQAFAHSYDLNCIALRFSNVYGEGQSIDYAGVITKFMNNIAKDKPLVIFGDGTYTRDFVSVDDVCAGIQNSLEKIEGKKGSSYNLATGKYTSIEDLAKIMISISEKSLEIIHDKPRLGDIKHSYASIELARKELGYEPKVELRQGIERLLKLNKS